MAESVHMDAATELAGQLRRDYSDVIEDVVVFGSVARSEQREASDVDILIVVTDEASEGHYEPEFRELAYDIELEKGVVLSLVIVSSSIYHAGESPFFQRVQQNAQSIYG